MLKYLFFSFSLLVFLFFYWYAYLQHTLTNRSKSWSTPFVMWREISYYNQSVTLVKTLTFFWKKKLAGIRDVNNNKKKKRYVAPRIGLRVGVSHTLMGHPPDPDEACTYLSFDAFIHFAFINIDVLFWCTNLWYTFLLFFICYFN